MNGTMGSTADDRDPKFYGELKQTNDDLLKYVETNHKKCPHFDYTNTFQSYIKQIADLIKRYPPGQLIQDREQEHDKQQNQRLGLQPQPSNDVTKVEETGADAEGEEGPPPEPNVEKYEETDARFQCRCKLYERFISNKDGAQTPTYIGFGELYVKPMDTPNKLHLIMRQDPDLRKVILNQVITPNIPMKCLPNAIQFLASSNEEGRKYYVTKVRDDKISSELFAILNSVKSL